MKILISLIAVLSCLPCFTAPVAAQVKSPDSGNHIHVDPRVSIVPPDGFVKASTFTGFQQLSTGSSIMIVNIPAPFSESIKAFTKDKLLSQGISVTRIEDITLNNRKAKLVTAEQNAQALAYSKLILCFGDANNTYIVNGSFPKDFEGLYEKIRVAMLSIIFTPDASSDVQPEMGFEITTEGTKLKHAASTLAQTSLYTTDGHVPTQSPDKTFLTVSQSFSEQDIADKEKFAKMRLHQLPFPIDSIESIQPIIIDNLTGYEIIATARKKTDSSPLKIYLAVLFSEKQYFLSVGKSEQDDIENILLFKKLTRTFRRK